MAFTGPFAGDPFKDSFDVFPLFLISLLLFLVFLSLSLVSAMVSEGRGCEQNIEATHICSFKATVDFNRSICCIPF